MLSKFFTNKTNDEANEFYIIARGCYRSACDDIVKYEKEINKLQGLAHKKDSLDTFIELANEAKAKKEALEDLYRLAYEDKEMYLR